MPSISDEVLFSFNNQRCRKEENNETKSFSSLSVLSEAEGSFSFKTYSLRSMWLCERIWNPPLQCHTEAFMPSVSAF